jgi:hexosaminidase
MKSAIENLKKYFAFSLIIFFVFGIFSCKIFTPMEDENSGISFKNIIPVPVSINPAEGSYVLEAGAHIYISPFSEELKFIGEYLSEKLRTSTGFDIDVRTFDTDTLPRNIYLTTVGGDESLGEEGYELEVAPEKILLTAFKPAGLFRGIQTLRQLFPPTIESAEKQSSTWRIQAGKIKDYPRFEWRGAMLDVSRHFFSVEDVKRYIDLLAFYKINRFHMHLSDDQGWRIEIKSWPNLTTHGGSTQVGGGEGGFYTQEEYSEIVNYADKRYIIVVPEIDMPGHTNAALSSYPVLNADSIAPPLYTGIEVGFSALAVHKEITYTFINDVIRELSALTTGPYIHIGGDEAPKVEINAYVNFIDRVQKIIQANGKTMVGWEEIAHANLDVSSIAQHWNSEVVKKAAEKGAGIIMSPSKKIYLDMMYNPDSPLGLHWAAYIEVKDSYDWDPANYINGVEENHITGIEAPLWTETILNIADIEYMAFPRVISAAEIGWSPQAKRNWDDYKHRLAEHGLRLDLMGVNYYKSPQIPWK